MKRNVSNEYAMKLLRKRRIETFQGDSHQLNIKRMMLSFERLTPFISSVSQIIAYVFKLNLSYILIVFNYLKQTTLNEVTERRHSVKCQVV